MAGYKKIITALISVFHKENLDEIVWKLHEMGVQIYSTGGTEQFIRSLGVPVGTVESLTGYPSSRTRIPSRFDLMACPTGKQ